MVDLGVSLALESIILIMAYLFLTHIEVYLYQFFQKEVYYVS